MKKSVSTFYVTYEYSSYMARRARVSASSHVNLVEFLNAVTSTELALTPRKRLLDDQSTNQMDHIGPLTTPGASEEWQLPVAEKRKFLFGDTRKD